MTTRKVLMVLLLLLVLAGTLFTWRNFATDRSVCHQLYKNPQNTLPYLNPSKQFIVSLRDQDKLAQAYLKQYFLPWNQKLSQADLLSIKKKLLAEISKRKASPEVGANTHHYHSEWIHDLEQNLNTANFPSQDRSAITLHDTNIRILPTTDPSFTDLTSASKGYPFDNLQETFIVAGTPVHIIHVSSDRSWFFVVASSYTGWIQKEEVAFVSQKFKTTWQTNHFAISTQDDIPLYDDQRQLTIKTRIGAIYPIATRTNNEFTILTPNQNSNHHAVAKPVQVSQSFLTEFPIPISNQNIAQIANNLMGKPYGWGGLYGYRDCSATMRDLMAAFGIWLPRNSSGQAHAGVVISLAGLSDQQKEKIILEQGIPFMTLIHLPGHIVLYIGQNKGHAVVFQNVWGLHIYKLFGPKDRIVIGQTVITPLNFGKKFWNTSMYHLAAADSMVLLVDPSLIYFPKLNLKH
jgi:cell wall-associated NlpC family hydrolase